MELRRFGELFADLARPVVDGADGVGVRLCLACVELLEVADAGILLVDGNGGMSCFATSGAAPVGVIEDLQFTFGEGPGLDAHTSGEPVFASDLAHPSSERWSAFASAALRQGVHGVFSFPLRVGSVRLGALDLSRATSGALTREQRRDGLVMAGLVTRRILTAQDGAPDGLLAHDLDDPRTLRAEVHQAAGMVSEQLDVRTADALVLLRAAAYAWERPIDDVAHDVVARRLRFDDDPM
jgi:hypothetical protein